MRTTSILLLVETLFILSNAFAIPDDISAPLINDQTPSTTTEHLLSSTTSRDVTSTSVPSDIVSLVLTAELPKFTSAEHVFEEAKSLLQDFELPELIGLLRQDTDVCRHFLGEPNADLSGVGVSCLFIRHAETSICDLHSNGD